jgi:hypothetical protein
MKRHCLWKQIFSNSKNISPDLFNSVEKKKQFNGDIDNWKRVMYHGVICDSIRGTKYGIS